MNWALRILAGQSLTWIPLTEGEYKTGVAHFHNIINTLELEEKFDVVIGNHEELESEIQSIAIYKTLHSKLSWQDGARNRRILNRRVNNLLSSCRLYIDHLRHGITLIFGDNSSELASLDELRHQHYDSSFSYRLLEEIRNYTQHRRLPIDVEVTSFKVTSFGDNKQVACCLTPMIETARLLTDDKLKSSFRLELEKQPERLNLTEHARHYLQSLYSIHTAVRQLLSGPCLEWEHTIKEFIQRSQEKNGAYNALYMVAQTDDTYPHVVEKCPVFMEPMEEIRSLQTRNELFTDLSTHYVTSQNSGLILQEDVFNPGRVKRDIKSN